MLAIRSQPPQMFTAHNGKQVAIRSATPNDAADTLALKLSLLREGVADALLPEECHFEVAQERVWIEATTSHPTSLMLVAEADGGLVGIIYFRCDEAYRCRHTGEFGMGLYSTWRSQGIGSALVQTLLDWAKSQPEIEKVGLRVYDINPKAAALYKKLGFVEEGRLKNHLRVAQGKYSDAILMAKFVK